jgi:hypothetical protein
MVGTRVRTIELSGSDRTHIRDGRLTANDRDTQWFFPMQYAGVVM